MTDEHPWRSKWAKPATVQSVTYTWWIRHKSLSERTHPTEGYKHNWKSMRRTDNVPVKLKLQHPPGHTPGIWRFFLPGRDGIWSPLIGVGNLIVSLDFMLRVALIPRGLINHGGDGGDKLWWIQKKRSRIRGGLVENQRPTQTLFCIWRCLVPIYIYL